MGRTLSVPQLMPRHPPLRHLPPSKHRPHTSPHKAVWRSEPGNSIEEFLLSSLNCWVMRKRLFPLWQSSSLSHVASAFAGRSAVAPRFGFWLRAFAPPGKQVRDYDSWAPSAPLWLLLSSLLACLSWNSRFVDMNIPPIIPNTIAKRISEPNRKERRPTASNSALPNPFVSFALVGISPSVNSTSLCQYRPTSAKRAHA